MLNECLLLTYNRAYWCVGVQELHATSLSASVTTDGGMQSEYPLARLSESAMPTSLAISTLFSQNTTHCNVNVHITISACMLKKLAQYGTYGRLLLIANFKVTKGDSL